MKKEDDGKGGGWRRRRRMEEEDERGEGEGAEPLMPIITQPHCKTLYVKNTEP